MVDIVSLAVAGSANAKAVAAQTTATAAQVAAASAGTKADAAAAATSPLAFANNRFAQTSGHRILPSGDSIAVFDYGNGANASVFWALARDPRLVRFNQYTDLLAVGGSLSDATASTLADYYGQQVPRGFIHPTRLARDVAAIGRGCDTVHINVGVNDPVGTDTVGNIIYYIGQMRAAGAKQFFVNAIPPFNTGSPSASVSRFTQSRNRALQNFCAINSDCAYFEVNGTAVDPAAAQFTPLGQNTNTSGAQTSDGLHPSAGGAFNRGSYGIAPGFARHFAPAFPDVLHGSDAYNATDALRGNLLGTVGRFGGTGGTVSFPNSTVTGGANAPAGWVIGGSVSGLTVDFSIVPCTYLNTRYNRSDFMCRRITLSGTPGTLTQIAIFNLTPVDITGFASTGPSFDSSFKVTANALSGIASLARYMQPNASGAFEYWGKQQGNPSDILPTFSGDLDISAPFSWVLPDTAKTTLVTGMNIGLRASVPISGSIDLVSASLIRV